MGRGWWVVALLSASSAFADPLRLKLSTPAPEGSSFARELHSFSREVSGGTDGHVEAKWYMGGITGDELEQIDRMKRGQLDGAGLAIGCDRLAPSLLAVRVAGLVQTRDEASLVLRRLKMRIDQEMTKSGFVGLGVGTLGTILAMTRTPVRTLADLRKVKLWVWEKDEIQIRLLRAMGLSLVPMPIGAAGSAYDDGRIDGFLAPPSVALAFQWSARTHFFLDFPIGETSACFVMSQRSFDELPVDERKILTSAGAKLTIRIEEVGREMDAALVGGLLEKQGVQRIAVDSTFVTQFFEQSRLAREQLDAQLISRDLITEVLGWLADYRAENPKAR